MNSDEKRLWALMNEFRGEKPDIVKIIKTAQERGIPFGFSELGLLSRHRFQTVELILPESIPEFVITILEDTYPKSILDPWAGTGSFLVPLVEHFNPKVSVGIVRSEIECEIAQLFTTEGQVAWSIGDTFSILDELDGEFNLIIGALPWGMKQKVPYAEKIGLSDDVGNLIMLKASQRLSKDGIGIFIVTPRFFFDQSPKSVKNNLQEYGLHLDAAFLLPEGVFEPLTSISGYLVILGREKQDMLFVGGILGIQQKNETLISNYRGRKSGKVPQHGVLVDGKKFRGLNVLIAEYEINKLVQRSNLIPFPLNDIALEINLPKRTPGEEYVDKENAVYLPLIGKSLAVATIEDLQIKPQNYCQIVLDGENALAPYVAKFFNTYLGFKVRESLQYGVIPKITKSSLINASIYLPELGIQKEVLHLSSIISNLFSELASLQNKLWEYPNRAGEIERSIKQFSDDKDLEIWMEELPFPLASILWAYYATKDEKERLEHLFHFFEASSQFIAAIFLSAYAQDKDFYKINRRFWITSDLKYQGWYRKASFGNWIELNFAIAKFTRKMLEGKDTKGRCLSLFGNADESFVKMLSSKRLLGILREAKDYRNSWKGHGGILSVEQAKYRVVILENLLAVLRDVVGDQFVRLMLLSPESSEFVDGIYEYTVKAIMGTRAQFKEEHVQTIVPMDIKKLYLLPELQLKPIEMLPLGRMMPSPKTNLNAYYFYNRLDDGEVRWVSYHFARDAEVIARDIDVINILKTLFEINNE